MQKEEKFITKLFSMHVKRCHGIDAERGKAMWFIDHPTSLQHSAVQAMKLRMKGRPVFIEERASGRQQANTNGHYSILSCLTMHM
jgi:hypothetical protein